MDTDDAIAQTLVALADAPDKKTLNVPREVLEAFMTADWFDDNEFMGVSRHGPSLWFIASHGCAYNVDQGEQEIPEEERDRALLRALLEHATREVARRDKAEERERIEREMGIAPAS